MKQMIQNTTLFFCSLILTTLPAAAEVKLPSIIGDNMAIQQGCPVKVWGWASPEESVTVTLGSKSKTTAADKGGKWMLVLPAMKAGPQTYTMKITSKPKAGQEDSKPSAITVTNIIVGEVWIGSGQSNMEWPVKSSKDGGAEITTAAYPQIRLYVVPKKATGKPQDDINARWVECSPATVGDSSAVLYFFGRTLHKELKVPMGLITSAWGGTLIEPWTPLAAFEADAKLAAVAEEARKVSSQDNVSNKTPAGMYNAMINALTPYAIRGALWYQGESNIIEQNNNLYFEKMSALIGGWRKAWGLGDFPFLYVQLAPFQGYKPEGLPQMWEIQTKCLSIPNTGMAITSDITDNVGDIHPRNKQDVGARLALWALAKTYGKSKTVVSGPLFKAKQVKGDKIVLTFDHVGGGLISRDGKPLTSFSIAGEDNNFVDAKAEIVGNTVVVSSDKVLKPVAVRFAWSNVAIPNLCNKEGLPAGAFRTEAR